VNVAKEEQTSMNKKENSIKLEGLSIESELTQMSMDNVNEAPKTRKENMDSAKKMFERPQMQNFSLLAVQKAIEAGQSSVTDAIKAGIASQENPIIAADTGVSSVQPVTTFLLACRSGWTHWIK
jgi:hypothetical protein